MREFQALRQMVFIFFSRYNKEDGFANLYWVSTQVIENVRPKQ